MTEEQLISIIRRWSDREWTGPQPAYVKDGPPIHPSQPVDYDQIRVDFLSSILGPSDLTYHPSLGTPHIDTLRYPPNNDREFWCYATSGMSDFPQVLPDGSQIRTELLAFSVMERPIIPELMELLGLMPFCEDTFLYRFHTVPFPEGIIHPRFTCAMLVPPYLLPKISSMTLNSKQVWFLSIILLTEPERQYAIAHSSEGLLDTLPDEASTWLVDGRIT